VNATFLADFASFQDACAKSEISLKGFESGSASVERQLNKMADAFSGRKIQQEAAEMARIFQEAGSAAKFTTAELARMSSVGDEAFEKLRKNGEPIPQNLREMVKETRAVGAAHAAAAPQVNDLTGSLQTFDGILGSLGIHIGPEIKAVGEIGSAAGKTSSQLGGLATAGLVVGASVAGWQLGRAVADLFDLDEAIARNTAKLFGWGDVAAQTAGAAADVLAHGAGIAKVALESLDREAEHGGPQLFNWRSQVELSAAVVDRWKAALAGVKDKGDLPQLTADITSQNFSLAELAKRYNVSVEALQFFARELAKTTDAEASAAAIRVANRAKLSQTEDDLAAHARDREVRTLFEITKLRNIYDEQRIKDSGTVNEIEIANIDKWAADLTAQAIKAGFATHAFYENLKKDSAQAKASVGIDTEFMRSHSISGMTEQATNALAQYNRMAASGDFYRAELEAQYAKYLQLRDAARGYGDTAVDAQNRSAAATAKHNAELAKQQKAIDDAAAAEARRQAGGSNQFDLSTPEGRAKVPGDIAGYLHDGYSFDQAALLAYAKKMGFSVDNDPLMRNKGPRVPGFETGGSTGGGGLALTHPGEYVVPKGGALVMRDDAGRGGGLAITWTGDVVVQGSLLTTRDELAAYVADGIRDRLEHAGVRFGPRARNG
jgi:hypothetical protein